MHTCNFWAYSDLGVCFFVLFDKKKRIFQGWKLFAERFFFITFSCWPPDSNFTIRKYTSVQYSQIMDKNLLLAFSVQMWRILQYNLLFSDYFDHSIH